MAILTVPKGKFNLGRLIMTRGVYNECQQDADFNLFVIKSLERHAKGDWGDLCDEDKEENEFALRQGDLRLFSSYKLPIPGVPTIWIITEADRSATTILFPEEY
jgi:hypothetical protein